jgi:ribosomal protein S18 acetylase RimI-like enzyme
MIIDIAIAQAADASEILDLQKRAFQSEARRYGNFEIAPLRQTLEEMEIDFTSHTFIKAIRNGKIAGSVKTRTVDGRCWVGRLIVDPVLQRKGIGTKLLNAVEMIVPDAKEYFLYTGSESRENILFYQKAGYAVNGQIVEDSGVRLIGMSKEKNG